MSIDLYSSVPSPSLNFLGTPTLSRLVADARQPLERRSSHSLLPSIQRRPSLRKATADRKSSKVSHEVSLPRQSSYGQAVVNGINVLCGVRILSTPYAVKEGGWVGLSILFIFAVVSYYTGILLRSCLYSQPGLETYPDIGHAAFGNVGRIATSVSLMPDPKARSYLCSLFVTAALICCVYFIGTAFLAKDDILNPFDLLGDDDTEDLSQLIAAQKVPMAAAKKTPAPAAARQQQSKPAAKFPSKPLPPAQAGHLLFE